jgi:hypothetical protein
MKRGDFEKTGEVNSPLDQDLDKVNKIYIRNLCAREHFFNTTRDSVSVLPENGLFSPFFDQEFEDFINNSP